MSQPLLNQKQAFEGGMGGNFQLIEWDVLELGLFRSLAPVSWGQGWGQGWGWDQGWDQGWDRGWGWL